ncbi:hypothetical protein EVC10_005 [Rhizobium phage RHph_Y25]|uniref:hypothetical protein n=1 Tax=Rhizobium TaxID=379 RepID=UPI0007EBF52F|nr:MULTISPECIES: hypothetical protein [Rhizobium]QIG73697.1 hypothetical protein EVC05_005 [Rhizobium phage RHph_N2]QIG74513.1 hypothetical protein EVC10_005 [Rhizobium phage RHph_Y25]QXV74415.1 hypothetical protein [Rhizobium phage RHEph18]ANL02695.1 hypothetical protein AMJ99_CH01108 [Rhizobium esperanzae]ANM33547.1 hypothetical protein AMK04_CH01109 [Rhizobium sp. N871]
MPLSYNPISVTAATLTLSARTHGGATVVANRAAGITMTLPASSGSGVEFNIIVGTTITSNNLIVQVANATDIMAGVAFQAADGGSTSNAWEAGASDDTITMDGSTKGGIKGDRIRLVDVASGVWQVNITGAATGTEATPFSAAVS